jgi:outer membrane lipoprotein-sorting protein
VGCVSQFKGDPKAALTEFLFSDVRRGGAEAELVYALSFNPAGEKYQIELTYDPKTLKPVKQVATCRSEKSSTVRTELYDAFEINEGLSDDQFGEAIGEDPAARALRKIQAVIFNSKTIRVKFDTEPPPPDPNNGGLGSLKGEIFLKEGNKTKVVIEVPAPNGQPVKSQVVVCDGKTVSGEFVHFESLKDPPKVLQEMLQVSLSGPGVLIGSYVIGYGLAMKQEKNQEPDLRKILHPMSIEAGEDEKGAKTVDFTLEGGLGVKVKLWYDPRDFRLLKRTITPRGEKQGSYVETFSEFVIDSELPDELFKVPPK